jgi:hypothetical protein
MLVPRMYRWWLNPEAAVLTETYQQEAKSGWETTLQPSLWEPGQAAVRTESVLKAC